MLGRGNASLKSPVDLEKENKMLRAEVLRQREEIELLEQRLDYVLRQLHSAKSEKFDPNQLTLLDAESKKSRTLLRDIRPGGGQRKRRRKK